MPDNADRPQHDDTAEVVLERLRVEKVYNLTDVVAVVTGGSTGIGLHIATTLLVNGAKTVYVVGLVQEQVDAIAQTYTEAAKKLGCPGKMLGIQGDISKKSEAIRLAKVIGDEEGYVTALFNNAGIKGAFVNGPLVNYKTAEEKQKAMLAFDGEGPSGFNALYDVHVVGGYYMSVAFLHLLAKSNEQPALAGRISASVSVTCSCSADGINLILAGHSYPYLFSKRAAMHMVSALALDFLPRNIRVNGINPGWFVTNLGNGPVNLAGVDSLGRSLSGGSFDKPPEKIPEIAPPSGKGARPQDMGMLALFLVCNDYFTGRVVTMDGGLMLLNA